MVAGDDEGADRRRVHERDAAEVDENVGVVETGSLGESDRQVHAGGDVVIAANPDDGA